MTVTGERPVAASMPSACDQPDDSAEALFKEAHQRRRRRRGVVGAALVVTVLVVFLVAWVLSGNDNTHAPPIASTASHSGGGVLPAMPSQMVAWAQTGTTMSIEVVSSRTGRVERTLASDIGLFRRTPEPAAAPDGTVYYDQALAETTQQGPGAHTPIEQVLRVPIAGGPSTPVAVGHDPAVSPDGRYLAYLIWTDITDGPEGVVVLNRLSGAVNTWMYSTNVPDINTISWSPNSRSLVVSAETLVGTGPRSTWHFLIKRLSLSDPNRSLDGLPQVQLPLCPTPTPWAGPGANREMAWAGFLNVNEGIGTCHHLGLTLQDNWTQPVIVDLSTGRVVRKLPVVPGLIGEGPGGGFLVDASGHHLVFIGNGLGAGGLYRWTIGTQPEGRQDRPALVRNNVGSASWVP